MDANKEKITQNRIKIKEFLASEKRYLEFDTSCELEERIRTIYSIIFPGFQKYYFYIRHIIARLAQFIDYSPVKVMLYRLIGVKIGKGVFISPDVYIDSHFPALISIADYAILGWGVRLFAHEFTGRTYRLGKINIGRGSVIGGYGMVRSGVSIGDMAEIAPSVNVYKDIPNGYKYGRKDIVKNSFDR